MLKADIRHYFDTVDHYVLLQILRRRIRNENVISLIRLILENHKACIKGNGMPVGNLTSQVFANVYPNELDNFVKHGLRAKYYIRYVDDFVVLHHDKSVLEIWKAEISSFLRHELRIELRQEKSRIIPLSSRVEE